MKNIKGINKRIMVLLLLGFVSASVCVSVQANIATDRVHINVFKGNSIANDSRFFKNHDYDYDLTRLQSFGVDAGVRLGDSPFAIAVGYLSAYNVAKNYADDGNNYKNQISVMQHRVGFRWIQPMTSFITIYTGGGIATHSFDWSREIIGEMIGDSIYYDTKISFAKTGLYAELAGVIEFASHYHAGFKVDYSFANDVTIGGESIDTSLLSYGLIAGVSF